MLACTASCPPCLACWGSSTQTQPLISTHLLIAQPVCIMLIFPLPSVQVAMVLLAAGACPFFGPLHNPDDPPDDGRYLTVEEEENQDCHRKETPVDIAKRKGHTKLHEMLQVRITEPAAE